MNYTYRWINAEQTAVLRTAPDGSEASIAADPNNVDYAEFLASGETAAPYTPSNTNGI